MKFKVHNDKTDYELTEAQLHDLDIIDTPNGHHILHNNKGYAVEIVSQEGKNITLLLNGRTHKLEISDEYDLLVEKMGLSVVADQKLSSVKAPMPGLILDIHVEPGQEIVEGDSLLILEAMKMENVIKASGVGVVKSIEAAKGDAVEKNQVLIEME